MIGRKPTRKATLAALLVAASVLAPAAASAQQPPAPAAVPDKMPFDTPYGIDITSEHAKQVLAAAEAEGNKRNWKMNIAVVDTHGDLVTFLRMDGAQFALISIAQGKARTATRYRRESRVFFTAFEAGHPYLATLDPGLVASPGGIPLVEGGKIIGAIGCSGGTGDQVAVICKAGADTVK